MKWNLFMIAWNSVFISFSSINLDSSDPDVAIAWSIALPFLIIGLVFHLICLMVLDR